MNRKAGRGTLFIVAMLFATSGALRLGSGVGTALAQAEKTAEPVAARAPASCEQPAALAEALSQREGRLVVREAALNDRQAALQLADEAITDRLIAAIEDPTRRAIVANFANLDQVGHLGRLDLAERAAASVDQSYRRLVAAAQQHGVTLLVTADHGNAEVMTDADGNPFGSHTMAPVPFFVLPSRGLTVEWRAREGSLANVASTFLDALSLPTPSWMEAPCACIRGRS